MRAICDVKNGWFWELYNLAQSLKSEGGESKKLTFLISRELRGRINILVMQIICNVGP